MISAYFFPPNVSKLVCINDWNLNSTPMMGIKKTPFIHLKLNVMCIRSIMIFPLLLPIVGFSQQVKIPDHWSDGYAYANGIRIHYYHAIPNKGKPVIIMVHGATDNGLCWTI
jgi:hypothetical protein